MMTHSSAAELLRGYAPIGMSLAGCLQRALAATAGDNPRHARVDQASRVLDLPLEGGTV